MICVLLWLAILTALTAPPAGQRAPAARHHPSLPPDAANGHHLPPSDTLPTYQ